MCLPWGDYGRPYGCERGLAGKVDETSAGNGSGPARSCWPEGRRYSIHDASAAGCSSHPGARPNLAADEWRADQRRIPGRLLEHARPEEGEIAQPPSSIPPEPAATTLWSAPTELASLNCPCPQSRYLQRDRSHVRLQVTLTWRGLSPLRPNALSPHQILRFAQDDI